MSTSVCYLERSASGALISRIRLVAPRAQRSWAAPATERAGADARASIAAAARWLAQESQAGPTRGSLVLCMDGDGAHCGWVTSPSAEEAVVSAAIRAAQTGGAEDAGASPAAWLRDGEIGVDMSVQGLPEVPGEHRRQRLAVLAVPDLPVRVLLDELDTLGRPPARVMNIWHAMAEVMADGVLADQPANGRPVAAAAAGAQPLSAMVLVEPQGRLLWAWSRSGRLVACGSMRLRRTAALPSEAQPESESSGALVTRTPEPLDQSPDVAVIEVSSQDVGRLITEWLAWSVQLGESPARVACAGPSAVTVAGLGEDLPAVTGIAAVAHAIGAAWPGAAVQAAVDEDPVGSVLHRVMEDLRDSGPGPSEAEPVADPRTALLDLSRRPGRASRGYYRWASVALFAGAAGIAALGYRMNRAAVATDEQAQAARAERLALLEKVKDTVNVPPSESDPVRRLQSELARIRLVADKITPEEPILPEFGRVLSAAAATPGAQLKSINLPTVGAGNVTFSVPDANTGPRLLEHLQSLPSVGRRMVWTGSATTTITGERTYSLRGTFVDPPRTPRPAPARTPAPAPAPAPAPGVAPGNAAPASGAKPGGPS